MMKSLCLVVLLGVVAFATAEQCGVRRVSSGRIVGGEDAAPHEFPWVVYMQMTLTPDSPYEPKMYGMCDGSLIDDQWIVTASHCFHPQPGYTITQATVVLGAHNLGLKTETGRIVVPASNAYRHPQFSDSDMIGSKHDIALVKLANKLDLTHEHNYIAPVCLPTSEHNSTEQHCTVIGWGRTGEFESASKILKKLDVHLMHAQECQKVEPEVSDLQVCAGTPHHGTCNGDSGGPLMCQDRNGAWTLKGIVSYGEKHCAMSKPGVFTNVEKFLDFIDQTRSQHA